PRFIADARTNSVIAIAPRSTLDEMRRVVERLDEKREAHGSLHTYAVRHADAEALATTLGALAKGGAADTGLAPGGGIQVNADPATSTLIVQASPHDYAALREVIERLDVRRPQVLVDVLLLEAQGSRGAELGTRVLQTALGSDGAPASGSGSLDPASAPF